MSTRQLHTQNNTMLTHTLAPLTVTVTPPPRDRATLSNFKVPNKDGISHRTGLTLAVISNQQKRYL